MTGYEGPSKTRPRDSKDHHETREPRLLRGTIDAPGGRGAPGNAVRRSTPPPEPPRPRESFQDAAIPRLLAIAGCGGLAVLVLLIGGNFLQKPVLEALALLPVLFVEYVVRQLDGRKLGFPASIRETIADVAVYAALLVIAADVEGLLLQGVGGTVSQLGLLNIITGVVLGALIGWRSPRHAIWTILEASFAAAFFGGMADLLIVGPQRFRQVHGGGSLVEVVIVSGAVFAASGILGCLSLRVRQWLTRPAAAAERDECPARAARPAVESRRGGSAATEDGRRKFMVLGLALVALIASIVYASAHWSSSHLEAGIYQVTRQVSSENGIVVTLVGVQVAPSGAARFLLTYQNEGSEPATLDCAGYTDPASVTTSAGQAASSAATFCSDHPAFEEALNPGAVLDSYAIFASDNGLTRPFSFVWRAGVLSGTVSQLTLAGSPAS